MNRRTLIYTAIARSACNALHAAPYPCADDTQIVRKQPAIAPRKTTPMRSRPKSPRLLASLLPKTDASMPAKHQHVLRSQVETT